MTLQIPYFVALTTYVSYGLMFLFGHFRDTIKGLTELFVSFSRKKQEYAPLCADYEDFYTRRLYKRLEDCWNRPISSAPGAWVDVEERERAEDGSMMRVGTARKCLNIGSYNYLGFGAPDKYCTPRVIETLDKFGQSTCSAIPAAGMTSIHKDLEQCVADFLGKEAAIVYGMGFATNSLTIPALVGKGDLILSDSLNHASIVAGARASGAKIKVFKHNVPESLEHVLRTAIAEGQPDTGRAWKKILIIVEGIYSMEGEICRLKEIVAIKKKYRAYLYLDEAHSIGALGSTGRGACEVTGTDPAGIDVMMGTFTKSFGSCGGYVAGSKELIKYLRQRNPGDLYATSISPPAAEQIISSMNLVLGKDGSQRGKGKIAQLRDNSNWFRRELRNLGLDVLGDDDSPVMPIMLYNPSKIAAFSRECIKRQVAVVVVGFPATPLLLSRARVCISASHTRADLEYALQVIDEVSDLVGLKYLEALQPCEDASGGEGPEQPLVQGPQQSLQKHGASHPVSYKNRVYSSVLTVVSAAKLAFLSAAKAHSLFLL